VKEALQTRTCIEPATEEAPEEAAGTEPASTPLPGVDIFLNPAKAQHKREIVKEKQSVAKNYFKTSDMSTLYPELFRILWQSTLPCFHEEGLGEHMLTSCQLAGVPVSCSDIFTRIPTDSGMCCALNTARALRASGYRDLVSDMQGGGATRTVHSQVGKMNGLRLVLDLHSNGVSFGTLDQEYDAFNMFIGRPAEFPVLKEKSLQLAPGHEHFIDLSATRVTAPGIRGIDSAARACYFPDEGNLTFYKDYTYTNCRLECGILQVEEILGCIPWYLPQVRHCTMRPLAHGSVQWAGRPGLPPRPPTPPPATRGLLVSSPPCWPRSRATPPRSAATASQTVSL
jgi:hypothetical protein